MTIEDYDIVGSYNNQRITSIDAERSVNVFEYRDARAKKFKILIPTSGLDDTDIAFPNTSGGFRTSFLFGTTTYHIIGNTLWTVNAVGNALVPFNVGTIGTATGYVGVDANTFQIIFVDGTNGYIYDTKAQTLTQITDTSFPMNPVDVTMLDGFFCVVSGGTPNFQLSSLNQGLVWGPAANAFTVNHVVNNQLTIGASQIGGASGALNYQTGVPVQLSAVGTEIVTAVAAVDITADTLQVADTTVFGPTGMPIKIASTGSLPDPLKPDTNYYIFAVSGTLLNLFNTQQDALNHYPRIDLTSAGSGSITILSAPVLPSPLVAGTTYYSLFVDSTHIKLAATPGGTEITLTTNGTGTLVITSLGQLQQGSITTHPGNIVSCRTLHRRLFLFSSFFTEVWENQGIGTNLPFRRNNSVVIEYGTTAPGNIAVGFDKMFFQSQDRDGLGAVMEVVGTQAIPISTKALDFQYAQYAAANQIADCRAFLMRENGIIFYRMNFTAANHTFIYNVTQSDPNSEEGRLWHEEEVLNGNRHPAQTHVFYNGTNYVGHYNTNILYEIDADLTTNDGEHIRRMRIPRPIVPPGYQRIRVNRFQIDLLQGDDMPLVFDNVVLLTESGNNITTEDSNDILTEQTFPIDQTIDPVVFLSLSKDGAQTFGNLIPANMGTSGNRTVRTVWRKLGVTKRGQAFQPKIEFFNPVPWYVLGASWDYEILPE